MYKSTCWNWEKHNLQNQLQKWFFCLAIQRRSVMSCDCGITFFWMTTKPTTMVMERRSAKNNMILLTNNKFARYFVHFFAVVAPLRHGTNELKKKFKKLSLSFSKLWNWIRLVNLEILWIAFLSVFFGLLSSKNFATMETWRSNLSSLFCDSLACIMIIIVPMFTVSAEAKDQPFSSLPTLAQLVQFVAGHPYLPSSRMNISFSAMVYPDADTCFFSLRLPTIYSSYDEFRKALNTAITCQHLGYGRG